MYRDQFATERARLIEELMRLSALETRVRKRFSKASRLNMLLRERALGSVELVWPSAVAETPFDASEVQTLARAELEERLHQTAIAIEHARGEARRLRQLVRCIEQRLRGRIAAEPLAPPPRRVPWSYLLAEWSGLPAAAIYALVAFVPRWVDRFVLGFAVGNVLVFVWRRLDGRARWGAVAISALAVALTAGFLSWSIGRIALAPIALGAAVADAVYAFKLRGFLSRCEKANVRVESSEATNNEATRSWARGWEIVQPTGPIYRHFVVFKAADGIERSVQIDGPAWENGVVLYDPKDAARVVVVHRLRSGARPDGAGHWARITSFNTKLRMLVVPLLFAAAVWVLLAR